MTFVVEAVPLGRVRRSIAKLNNKVGVEQRSSSRMAAWTDGRLKPDHIVFVARLGRQIIGWSACQAGRDKSAILGVYVHPQRRCIGAGSVLALAAMAQALTLTKTVVATNDIVYARAAKLFGLRSKPHPAGVMVTAYGGMAWLYTR